jgi:ubiquinone/menaquinone biosynthesis C-methylase UbiE
VEQIVGIDGHLQFLSQAKEQQPKSEFIHCDVTNIPLIANQFDLVLALDVLEHVNPMELLNEAYRLTKPGGHILIAVPAFQFLWSSVDYQAGHRLRYTIKLLKQDLANSGWVYQNHTYYQFLLFPFVYISRKLSKKSTPKFEHKPPSLLNKIFGWINAAEVKFFAKRKLPYGSSIVAIAKKPE